MSPIDEGPSPEDIARFSHDTDICPECGAEVYDGADVCPECLAFIELRGRVKGGAGRRIQAKWLVVVAVIVIVAFFLTFVL
jgi:hypothetical protein